MNKQQLTLLFLIKTINPYNRFNGRKFVETMEANRDKWLSIMPVLTTETLQDLALTEGHIFSTILIYCTAENCQYIANLCKELGADEVDYIISTEQLNRELKGVDCFFYGKNGIPDEVIVRAWWD